MATTTYTPLMLRGAGTRGVPEVPAGSSTDSDAQAFIDAASITDPTQQTAINNLVVSLKDENIWTKMKLIYPFVGGTDTSHSYNLVNPSQYQITWTAAVTHTSDGVKGATSATGHGDTGVTPSTLGIGRDDASMGVYSQEGWINNQQFPLGIYSGNQSITFYKSGAIPGSLWAMINDALAGTDITAPNPLTGFHQASRTQSSELSYKHNATTITTITAASAATPHSTKNLWVLAANGYTDYGYAATTSLIYFGLGLTDSELGEMNTIVTTYQTELGREI